VLTVTQMLRKHGVVEKFVEFFGPGLAELSVPDRATIANMAPEYGATCGFFPIDEQTLDYLRFTGRDEPSPSEAYCKANRASGATTGLAPSPSSPTSSSSTSPPCSPRWPAPSARRTASCSANEGLVEPRPTAGKTYGHPPAVGEQGESSSNAPARRPA
jgi:hypothetical protein